MEEFSNSDHLKGGKIYLKSVSFEREIHPKSGLHLLVIVHIKEERRRKLSLLAHLPLLPLETHNEE